MRDLAGIGRDGDTELPATFAGKIETVTNGELPLWDAAVYLTDGEQADGLATAAAVAAELERPLQVVVIGNHDENQMRQVAARFPVDNVWFVTSPRLAATTPNGLLAALQQLWKDRLPDLVAAGTWVDEVLARFARTFPRVQAVYRVTDVQPRDGGVDLITPAWDGKVCRRQPILALDAHPLIMTATGDAAVKPRQPGRVAHLALTGLAYDPAADDLAGLIAAAARETTATSIADARFIIDVGYAVRDQEQFDRVIMPLKRRLEEIGVGQVMLGGTRKVVEELKLLKPDQQIGQTGIAVDPNIIIAIGVSGAPQHIDYIGEHATIIAFNKDAEAPLMTLNQRRARPKVIPLVGDLYDLVPEFTAAL